MYIFTACGTTLCHPHRPTSRRIRHPYVWNYMLKSDQTWVLCMHPLMAKLLSESDFIEVDVTYKASVELVNEYLLNVVTFNYTTLKCEFTSLDT